MFGRVFSRQFSTSHTWGRISDNFKIQFRLPGRTTSVLSSGIVRDPNDPMIPNTRYPKPKGIPQGLPMAMLLSRSKKPYLFQYKTKAFELIASPWSPTECPRDHNGHRFQDYRVSILAFKKQYSRKAFQRWRAVRVLRTAARMVLPDKGLKRCDYVFIALTEMRNIPRDKVWLLVEEALVDVRRQIEEDVEKRGGKRANRPNMAYFDLSTPNSDNVKHKSTKIMVPDPNEEPAPLDYCISNVLVEYVDDE